MKKLLATLLASAMALTAIGGLVACGGDNDDGKGGGKLSDYYLVGVSAGSLFSGTKVEGWTPIGTKDEDGEVTGAATRKELPDKLFLRTTNKANVYTITVELYKNDQFCICDAKAGEEAAVDEGGSKSGWDNQIKFVNSDGTVHGTESQYIGQAYSPFGAERNFGVLKAGKYKITYDAKGKDEDDIEVGYVSYERVGEATPLQMPDKEVYIKGNLDGLNDWGHGFANDWKLAFDATKKEYTFTVPVTADDVEGGKQFGLAMYDTGATTGDGDFMDTAYLGDSGDANDKWGATGNFAPTQAGTYKLVLKWNNAWEIDFYAQA